MDLYFSNGFHFIFRFHLFLSFSRARFGEHIHNIYFFFKCLVSFVHAAHDYARESFGWVIGSPIVAYIYFVFSPLSLFHAFSLNKLNFVSLYFSFGCINSNNKMKTVRFDLFPLFVSVYCTRVLQKCGFPFVHLNTV